MASIKVSELPAVTSITPSDVLVINDENLITSSITISLFTSSFTGQNLTFTGNAAFTKPVTFGTGSLPTVNSATVFNESVTFNGALVLSAAAQFPINTLSNVTTVEDASIPTGNVLTWDAAEGYWKNAATGSMNNLVDDTTPHLGGNLDVNGYAIVSDAAATGPNSVNIELNPNGAGKVIFQGNVTRGSGRFNLQCEAGTHDITVAGPPHSAAATYTFTFPNDMGTSGQALLTNGTNGTSWGTVLQPMVNNNLQNYVDDTAAATGGVPIGGIYRTGNDVKYRVN